MIKKLIIPIFILSFVVQLSAQTDRVNIPYSPKKGNWQISLIVGSSNFFSKSDNGYNSLLPTDDGSNIGVIPGSSGNQSLDPSVILNLGEMSCNALDNMVGVSFGYFFSDKWEATALVGLNSSYTPKRDFVDMLSGTSQIAEMPLPNYQYILGRMSHAAIVELGLVRRMQPTNERVSFYLGIGVTGKAARAEAIYPYTGETIGTSDEPRDVYRNSYRAGQVYAIRPDIIMGVEYSLAPGLVLGFEVCPVSYQLSILEIRPSGLPPFMAEHHALKVFSQPRLKIGIRF